MSKAKNKSPAFQFYAAEFLVDENVVLMSNRAVGCYIKLMAYCWREKSIPAEVPKIARLCGEDDSAMADLWQSIGHCFESAIDLPGRLVHPRLVEEREKQAAHSEERAAAGKKGADKRWAKQEKVDGSANGSAMPEHMAGDASSSSTSSSTSTNTSGSNTAQGDCEVGGPTVTPTRAVDLSIAARSYGVQCQPANPLLVQMAEQGVTAATMEAACADARKSKGEGVPISLGYVVGIIKRWSQEASQLQATGAQAPRAAPSRAEAIDQRSRDAIDEVARRIESRAQSMMPPEHDDEPYTIDMDFPV